MTSSVAETTAITARRMSSARCATQRWMRMLAALLLPWTLSGCYVMQAARGQMEVLSRREPIQRVIERPGTSDTLRRRLQYVVDARQFAITALGLPDNDSYRSYADLRRSYIVWNVFATPEFSIEPHRWCFPIAGCVVYRGYFREAAAQRYARGLRANGYDASVGGVAAYSTLGHFSDPVLNTMLNWSDAQLAATLFHELAHQVLYLPGDSEFNEAFATVVEEEGITRWLEQRGNPAALAQWREQRRREAAVSQLLLETRERLRSLYATDLAAKEMRQRKNQLFGELKFRYDQLKATWNGYGGYDRFFDRALNNAHLVAAATYRECVPVLRREFVAAGSQFEKFYARMRQLTAQNGTGSTCERLELTSHGSPAGFPLVTGEVAARAAGEGRAKRALSGPHPVPGLATPSGRLPEPGEGTHSTDGGAIHLAGAREHNLKRIDIVSSPLPVAGEVAARAAGEGRAERALSGPHPVPRKSGCFSLRGLATPPCCYPAGSSARTRSRPSPPRAAARGS